MKTRNLINSGLLIIIVLFVYVAAGCETSYDTMFDEFNTAFTNANNASQMNTTSVNDSNFDATKMLSQESYTISADCNMLFNAPEGAVTVTWMALVPVSGKTGEYKEHLIGTGSVLSYKLPGVFQQGGVRNELILKITTAAGAEYTDRAGIILFTK